MDKPHAYYILLGLLVGTAFGAGVGAINGDAIHGIQLGAMAGMFIGWIVTGTAVRK